MTPSRPEPFLSLGFSAVDWVEHFLVHGPGDVQGQPIELDDEFAAFIVKAYQVDRRGSRKVRRAFLSRSKGRNKSGTAAMVACLEALGPCRFDHFAEEGEVSDWGYEYEVGEPVGKPVVYAEVLCVATEEDQAGNTYDAIYYMLNPETCSPNLLAEFGKIDVGLTRINLPGRRGFVEPVSSSDKSADGGKSTFIVADETHLWVLPRLKRLHGTMTRNLLKRKIASGWMLETSTMYGEGESSVAEGTHEYAKAVAAGRKNDRTLLFDHRQADTKWDLAKRSERLKALREAYGPASEWMNLSAIADSWDDPQVTESDFRRYWLNQPVPTDVPAPLALPRWPACKVDVADPPKVRAIGLAVSIDREWAGIAAAGRWDDDRVNVGVTDRRQGTGWLVAEALRIQRERGCAVVIDDKSPAATLITELEEAGVVLVKCPLADVQDACGDFYDGVDQGRITHMGDEELAAEVATAKKRVVYGRWTWDRRHSNVVLLEGATLAAWAVNAGYDPLDSIG